MMRTLLFQYNDYLNICILSLIKSVTLTLDDKKVDSRTTKK